MEYFFSLTTQAGIHILLGLSVYTVALTGQVSFGQQGFYAIGAYVSAIELLKDVAPFTCFLEHDVPRQRLFQAALAAYGRE